MYAQTVTPRRNKIKPKVNKVLLLKRNNFPFEADNFLQTITIGDMVLMSAKKKTESKDGPLSSKRSSFIGVSRNGLHWQALITINKRKTYIGSFECEKMQQLHSISSRYCSTPSQLRQTSATQETT